jgi:hypothetical protein
MKRLTCNSLQKPTLRRVGGLSTGEEHRGDAPASEGLASMWPQPVAQSAPTGYFGSYRAIRATESPDESAHRAAETDPSLMIVGRAMPSLRRQRRTSPAGTRPAAQWWSQHGAGHGPRSYTRFTDGFCRVGASSSVTQSNMEDRKRGLLACSLRAHSDRLSFFSIAP